MIITIDGPAGTGKTTIAKRLAGALHLPYFDTGAMYRAATWYILQNDYSIKDHAELAKKLEPFSFHFEKQNGELRYFVGQTDVTQDIRGQKVESLVSEVAAIEEVRRQLWKIQKKHGETGFGVFEGRDVGSVVFPHADLKIFLKANEEVRAQRRLDQIRAKPDVYQGHGIDREQIAEAIQKRDRIDSSRKVAPLKIPKGAVIIDTSELDIEQVLEKIFDAQKKVIKKMGKPWCYSKEMNGVYRVCLFLAWSLCKLFYRHKVYGLEHFYRGGGILAANHTSYLDPPLVAISWPEEVSFLARSSLFKPFLFGRLIRRLNALPVSSDTADLGVFKTVIQRVKEGKKIILFPEGERTFDGKLSEIKPGIAFLISKTNAPIIPVYVGGAHEAWGRRKKWPKLHGQTVCVFGSPIFFDAYSQGDKKQMQQLVADSLTQALKRLEAWWREGAKGTPP